MLIAYEMLGHLCGFDMISLLALSRSRSHLECVVAVGTVVEVLGFDNIDDWH